MNKTRLRKYAQLIIQKGVNVQKGQEVLVYAELDQPEFVKLVVEEAYKAKAKKVTVEWSYQSRNSKRPASSITATLCPPVST